MTDPTRKIMTARMMLTSYRYIFRCAAESRQRLGRPVDDYQQLASEVMKVAHDALTAADAKIEELTEELARCRPAETDSAV